MSKATTTFFAPIEAIASLRPRTAFTPATQTNGASLSRKLAASPFSGPSVT